MRIIKQKLRVVHPILPSLTGPTGVGLDEAKPLGLEVARLTDYASRHLVRPSKEPRNKALVLFLCRPNFVKKKKASPGPYMSLTTPPTPVSYFKNHPPPPPPDSHTETNVKRMRSTDTQLSL
jgi:hypothetical protein